ncbi:hypothetical protein EWM64_g9940 [Hericium alpestre]|uniref:Uncharacterized protein n=1 Tax=Hericium alpestre TaxID=135208 RepID=A0A4Y9ZHG4_9AGAM|nr:hypothetical protein EWM64_g9940 [Hericium alpestre]
MYKLAIFVVSLLSVLGEVSTGDFRISQCYRSRLDPIHYSLTLTSYADHGASDPADSHLPLLASPIGLQPSSQRDRHFVLPDSDCPERYAHREWHRHHDHNHDNWDRTFNHNHDNWDHTFNHYRPVFRFDEEHKRGDELGDEPC